MNEQQLKDKRDKIRGIIDAIIFFNTEDCQPNVCAITERILEALSSENVVIAAENAELPEVEEIYKDFGGNDSIWEASQQDMLNNKFFKTYPLVEER